MLENERKLLLKENVINFLLENKNKKIYISSQTNNLEYYYNILDSMNIEEIENKYIDLNSYSELDIIGRNIEIIEFLRNEKPGILFIDLNIALKVFFEKVKYINFELNKEYDREEIIKFLEENKYVKNYIISNKGEYSIRGDIIDIFPANLDYPIRLDFFDIELENIKIFSSLDQKSISFLKEIKIYSNILKGYQKEIVTLLKDVENIEIYIENKELLDIKLYHILNLNKDDFDVINTRYNNLIKESKFLDVSKTENKNYNDELKKIKRHHQKKGIKYTNVNQILENDYVIHVEFGIGIYKGIVNINNRDYLYVKYLDNDKLYIPVEKLDRINKYISTGIAPKLYSLGTKGFKKKEKKLREDIEKFAIELVEIQAKRELSTQKPFSKDSIWQEEFEEKFLFNLTLDQKKVIAEIKEELEKGKLMDRILVGDVGYGKTEVALQIAFKAIENGYQCAILAPTTVLANQHYERCHKRFEEFGIRVENFSRLTNKNSKYILQGIKDGTVDLVVGTHKLLSDNVKFKNLGLLIIDEEQKFGVKAKEKLKQKKENVHLLTLSATPIPRTLNLALLGIRDISIISTSPQDRLAIITKKISNDELKDAILKEIYRNGQVFYITNEVSKMENKKKELKSILPSFINIEYIHGKLTPNEIKKRINDFDEGKFDILIASTIIENGIDITNANTIIIEKYTNLGLSQIYQLRGRVGRGKRQGYCYLLEQEFISKKGKEKEKSLDKIEGIEGGGYILSLEDLNIRGAGEILGDKQHGAIDAFGYDLYIKMLKNEINRLKGKKIKELKNVEIDLFDNGYIPENYIEKDERILIYKRYSEIDNIEDLDELNEEIRDRFGKIPEIMKKFIYAIKIKIYLLENNIEKIKEEENYYILIKNYREIKILKEFFNQRIENNLNNIYIKM